MPDEDTTMQLLPEEVKELGLRIPDDSEPTEVTEAAVEELDPMDERNEFADRHGNGHFDLSPPTHTIDLGPGGVNEMPQWETSDFKGKFWATAFGQMIRVLPIPALLLDRSLEITAANDSCSRLRPDPTGLVGERFPDLFPFPATAKTIEKIAEDLFSSGKPQVGQGVVQVGTNRIWGRMTFRPIRLMEDRFALVLVEDLTAEKKQLILQRRHNELLKQEINRRKEIEERLAQSEALYRQVVETASDAIYRTDYKGCFTYLNQVALRRSGYSEQELIGEHFIVTIHPDHRQEALQFYARQFAERIPETYFELPVLSKDGQTIWIGQKVQLLREGDWITGFQSIARDITDRKEAQDRLEVSLKEKEVLMREIHHRVKNNFQIISGLLAMQADRIRDATYKEILNSTAARIEAMALVHERLYQSDNLGQIRIDEYIMSVLHDLISFPWGGTERRVSLDTDVENISFGPETAITIGLIITEVVANSLKYAFSDGRQGIIRVKLRSVPDEQFELSIGDNGSGMPANANDNGESLGLRLVQAFVKKLRGLIELSTTNGTEIVIRFREVREGG